MAFFLSRAGIAAGAIFIFAAISLVAVLPARAESANWDPRLTRGTLDNGLSYIIHDSEKPEDPFNIRLVVHAGSVDEDKPGGVAHILEHMVFQSTRAHPESIHRYLQSIGWKTGLQVNAMTRETETQYMIRTRPDDALDIDGSLALMADIAFGAEILDEDWQREKLVILEELRLGDNVASRISRQKKEILRTGSRYVDRPTIGTIESINQTTIADIRAFHEKFHVASNMTLILSGSIDREKAIAAIRQHFGPASARPAPDRSYTILPLEDGIHIGTVQDEDGSSSQVTYALRLPMPERKTADGQFAYLQNYFLTRLIRDEMARYGRHYREEADALTFVAQETTNERLILAFNARTTAHDEAWPVLLETVERLRRDGLAASGFEQLMTKARRINSKNPDASESRTFAEWEDKITSAVLMGTALDDPRSKAARLSAMLDRVTLNGLNDRLREMLSASDRVLFYQLPGGVEKTTPPAAVVVKTEERLAALEQLPVLPTAQIAVVSEALSLPTIPEGMSPSKGGTIVSEILREPSNVVEWQLSNGDRVIWLKRDTPDGKVYVSGQSSPGYLNAEFGSVLSQAAVQLWHQSGFSFWTQDEFDRWNSERKGRWSWALKKSTLDIAVAAERTDLPKLLRDYAMSIAFGTIRKEAFTEFQSQARSSRHADVFSKVLYGPEAETLTDDTIQQLQIGDLREASKRFLRAPVTWFAVGPAPDGAIKNAFATTIAGIARETTLTAKPAYQRNGFNTLDVETFDSDRAKVTMSFYAPMDWTPEGAFITSALTPLAQQALRNRLRLELGGIYSLQFELEMDQDTDRITGTLTFQCSPARAQELAQAALSVLQNMPAVARSANVDRLKADIEFAEETRLNDPNTWLRRLALSYRRYDDAGYLDRMHVLPGRVTPAVLAKHANSIFAMNNVALMTQLPKSE